MQGCRWLALGMGGVTIKGKVGLGPVPVALSKAKEVFEPGYVLSAWGRLKNRILPSKISIRG